MLGAIFLLVGCDPGEPRPVRDSSAEARAVRGVALAKPQAASARAAEVARDSPVALRPSPGTYRLVEPFSVRGCVRQSGGCFSQCVEERTRTYSVGEEIAADVFFWDDASKEWGAKVVVFGINRSIPMSYLARAR